MKLHPIHPDGIALLKELEGLRLKAYQCSAGVWTIGYGHTAGVKKGDTITEAQAEEMLEADLFVFANGVRKALGGTALNAYRFAAMVIFAFNIGLDGFRHSTALRHIKARNFAEVPDAMRLWHKGGEDGVLAGRREKEIKLWNRTWTPT